MTPLITHEEALALFTRKPGAAIWLDGLKATVAEHAERLGITRARVYARHGAVKRGAPWFTPPVERMRRDARRPWALHVNLLRPRLRRVGLYLKLPLPRMDLPEPERSQRFTCLVARVQLYRPVPGLGRVPCPMLHLPGHQATPERWAALCGPLKAHGKPSKGGPYGRAVWIRSDRPSPLKACSLCEAVRAGTAKPVKRRVA